MPQPCISRVPELFLVVFYFCFRSVTNGGRKDVFQSIWRKLPANRRPRVRETTDWSHCSFNFAKLSGSPSTQYYWRQPKHFKESKFKAALPAHGQIKRFGLGKFLKYANIWGTADLKTDNKPVPRTPISAAQIPYPTRQCPPCSAVWCFIGGSC